MSAQKVKLEAVVVLIVVAVALIGFIYVILTSHAKATQPANTSNDVYVTSIKSVIYAENPMYVNSPSAYDEYLERSRIGVNAIKAEIQMELNSSGYRNASDINTTRLYVTLLNLPPLYTTSTASSTSDIIAAPGSTYSYHLNLFITGNYTLSSISTNTTGFSIYDITPSLPVVINESGVVPLNISMTLPQTPYYGNLTFVLNYT